MENLTRILNEHTDPEHGSWSLDYNDYTIGYCKDVDSIKEYYQPTCEEDIPEWEQDVKDIDWSKPIYRLFWYKDTPVGNYEIISNSIDGLTKEVKGIVEHEIWKNIGGMA